MQIQQGGGRGSPASVAQTLLIRSYLTARAGRGHLSLLAYSSDCLHQSSQSDSNTALSLPPSLTFNFSKEWREESHPQLFSLVVISVGTQPQPPPPPWNLSRLLLIARQLLPWAMMELTHILLTWIPKTQVAVQNDNPMQVGIRTRGGFGFCLETSEPSNQIAWWILIESTRIWGQLLARSGRKSNKILPHYNLAGVPSDWEGGQVEVRRGLAEQTELYQTLLKSELY